MSIDTNSTNSNNSNDISYEPEVDSDDYQEDESTDTIYFKYEFEGLTNVDQIIERLEELKSLFLEYKKHNCELARPVDTGCCIIKDMKNH